MVSCPFLYPIFSVVRSIKRDHLDGGSRWPRVFKPERQKYNKNRLKIKCQWQGTFNRSISISFRRISEYVDKEKLIEQHLFFFYYYERISVNFFLIAWFYKEFLRLGKIFGIGGFISVTDPNINVIDENSINRPSYLSVSSMTTAKIKDVDTHEQTGFLRLTLSSAVICLQWQDTHRKT